MLPLQRALENGNLSLHRTLEFESVTIGACGIGLWGPPGTLVREQGYYGGHLELWSRNRAIMVAIWNFGQGTGLLWGPSGTLVKEQGYYGGRLELWSRNRAIMGAVWNFVQGTGLLWGPSESLVQEQGSTNLVSDYGAQRSYFKA